MTAITHLFEHEQRTMPEIRAMVPRMGDHAIRNALKAGRNTRIAMLTFCPKRASAAGSKKSYAARGKPAIIATGRVKETGR